MARPRCKTEFQDIERGITVRQGLVVPLRKAPPDILSSNTDVLSPRMVSLIADPAQDWRRRRCPPVVASINSGQGTHSDAAPVNSADNDDPAILEAVDFPDFVRLGALKGLN
jgi:transposase